MEKCPLCKEFAYGPHEPEECTTCERNICRKCLYGCRYTCPLAALPPPKKLERQLGIFKWENAEEHLRDHPELTEMIVQEIPNEHMYKLVRGENGAMIRLHYDRICTDCNKLFLHEKNASRFFVCPECLTNK